MFKFLRFYTSGNLFFEKEKFELINNNFDQINIMVNSLDEQKDLEITGYSKNIWKTENIKKCKNIKLDISLTQHLNLDTFFYDIEAKLKNFPNIKKIKLKRLKSHGSPTKQKKWIDENCLSESEIIILKERIAQKYKSKQSDKDNYFVINETCRLVLRDAGRKNPTKWIFIKNDKLYNYFDKEIFLDDIQGGFL